MSVKESPPWQAIQTLMLIILSVSGLMTANLMVFSHLQHRSAELLGARGSGLSQSVAQCISGALAVPVGRCSDRFGYAQSLTGLGLTLTVAFAVLGAPPSSMQGATLLVIGLPLMKVFRLSEEVSKAAIADICTKMNISTSLWMSRLVAGIGTGLFLGPQLGSWMHNLGGWRGQNLAAGVVAFLASSLVFVFRKDVDHSRSLMVPQKVADEKAFTWAAFVKIIMSKHQLCLLFFARFFMSVQFYTFISMMGTYFRYGLGVGPAEQAFAASYVGIVFAFMSVGIVPHIIRRAPLGRCLVGSILLVSVTRFAAFFWGRTYQMYLIIITFGVFGQSIYLTLMSTAMQAAAPEHLRATIGGTAQFFETVAAVISPIVAGCIVGSFGPFSHFLISAFFALLAVIPASYAQNLTKED